MRSDRFALLSLVVPFLTLAASELARRRAGCGGHLRDTLFEKPSSSHLL